MDFSGSALSLSLSIIFGCIGMGFAAYGRKGNFYFLLSGLALLAITFFSLDAVTLSVVGVALVIAPFIMSRL